MIVGHDDLIRLNSTSQRSALGQIMHNATHLSEATIEQLIMLRYSKTRHTMMMSAMNTSGDNNAKFSDNVTVTSEAVWKSNKCRE